MLRDAGSTVWDAAASAGYRAGLMLERGLASTKRRMAINRINVPGNQRAAVFRSRAGGVYVIGQRLSGNSRVFNRLSTAP